MYILTSTHRLLTRARTTYFTETSANNSLRRNAVQATTSFANKASLFRCKDSNEIIHQQYVGDGNNDCLDSSDECKYEFNSSSIFNLQVVSRILSYFNYHFYKACY